jgi:hypothetical protein
MLAGDRDFLEHRVPSLGQLTRDVLHELLRR